MKFVSWIIFPKGDWRDMAIFICSGLIVSLQRFTEYCIQQNFYSKPNISFARAALQLFFLFVGIVIWTAYLWHLLTIDIIHCFVAYSDSIVSFFISLLFIRQFKYGQDKIDEWIDKLIKVKSAINDCIINLWSDRSLKIFKKTLTKS